MDEIIKPNLTLWALCESELRNKHLEEGKKKKKLFLKSVCLCISTRDSLLLVWSLSVEVFWVRLVEWTPRALSLWLSPTHRINVELLLVPVALLLLEESHVSAWGFSTKLYTANTATLSGWHFNFLWKEQRPTFTLLCYNMPYWRGERETNVTIIVRGQLHLLLADAFSYSDAQVSTNHQNHQLNGLLWIMLRL